MIRALRTPRRGLTKPLRYLVYTDNVDNTAAAFIIASNFGMKYYIYYMTFDEVEHGGLSKV